MKSLTTGLEQQLKQLSAENPDYSTLWESWCINKRKLESFLQVVIGVFPHYSLHDATHSRNIVNNIEMLLGDERIKLMGATDIWLLLNSVYAHDIGMIAQPNLENLWNSDENFREYFDELINEKKDTELGKLALKINSESSFSRYVAAYDTYSTVFYIIADYRRINHAKTSAKAIVEDDFDIDLSHKLIPRRFIDWIGKIVTSHGTDFSFILGLDKRDNGFCRDYIHPRFLSTLLCLGDALEMDNARFHQHSQLIMPRPLSSEAHHKKHEAIRQLYITPECIEITAEFNSKDELYHETYRGLKWWCDMLQRLVDNTAIHWGAITPDASFGNAPVLKQIKYIADDKEMDAKLAELKFEISQETALEFAQGSNIYRDKNVFIRELLQNALDSTKIQFWQDVVDGRFTEEEIEVSHLNNFVDFDKFQPYNIRKPEILKRYKIVVRFNPISDVDIKVEVSDSGTGIGKEQLLYMGKVGESYRLSGKKKLIAKMPRWLRPTGSFGIGLQSLFLASKDRKFECFTRSRSSGERYKIDFTSANKGGGYLNVHNSDNDQEVKYGANFTLVYEHEDYLYANTMYPEFSERVQAVYNEFDYFLNKKPDFPKARIGIMALCNYISNQLDDFSGLFPIEVYIGEELVVQSQEQFSLLRNFNDKENIDNDGNFVRFDTENLVCYNWDAEHMFFSATKLAHGGGSQIYFKDISVNTRSTFPMLSELFTEINIFGDTADKLLTINREELKNPEVVGEYLGISINLWIENFVENIDEIILKADRSLNIYFHVIALHLLSLNWACDNKTTYCVRCQAREKTIQKLLESDRFVNIRGLVLDGEEYKSGGVCTKKLIAGVALDPEYKVAVFRANNDYEKTKVQLQNIYQRTKNSPFKAIYLNGSPLADFLGKLDDELVLGDEYKSAYFNVKSTKPVQSTEYPDFIEAVVASDLSRIEKRRKQLIVANCVKPYEGLALHYAYNADKQDDFHLTMQYLRGRAVSPDMIIPLSECQISELKCNPMPKNEFIDGVVKSHRFEEILKFTHEHQYEANTHSIEELKKAYELLIGDVYDACIKHSCRNRGGQHCNLPKGSCDKA